MQRTQACYHYHCRDQDEVLTISDTQGLTSVASDGTPPGGSPSSTPTPSPPRQRTAPKQQGFTGRALASKGSSSIRLTGSKRALSSRSNQDSARQLMTKQRISRASAVGIRSSAEARRLSSAAAADASRSMDNVGTSGQTASEGAVAAAGAAVRAGGVRQHNSALLQQSLDLKEGNSQAVHLGRAEYRTEPRAAAARKAVSQKVSLPSLG